MSERRERAGADFVLGFCDVAATKEVNGFWRIGFSFLGMRPGIRDSINGVPCWELGEGMFGVVFERDGGESEGFVFCSLVG